MFPVGINKYDAFGINEANEYNFAFVLLPNGKGSVYILSQTYIATR